MTDSYNVTTDAAVKTYESATGVFGALLHEVRELSRKKPDATLSKNKVKLINNVLSDLMSILDKEPEGKYLQILEDDDLPQVSDALMMMVQFNAALEAFQKRYYQYAGGGFAGKHYWITNELLEQWGTEEAELKEEEGEGEEGEDQG
jgi:hypothetical protein